MRSASDLWMGGDKPRAGCGCVYPENASPVGKAGPKSTLNGSAVMRFQGLPANRIVGARRGCPTSQIW